MRFAKMAELDAWDVFDRKISKGKLATVTMPGSDPDVEPVIESIALPADMVDAVRAAFEPTRVKIAAQRRELARKTLILCEGGTEQHYITELVQFLGVENRVEIWASGQTDPGAAVQAVLRDWLWNERLGINQYRDVWLVFDRDRHALYRQAEKLRKTADNVHLVLTRPCIEYWFLLHFKKFKDDLPLDGKVIYSTVTNTEVDDDGIHHAFTYETFEPVTLPETCLNRLVAHQPDYKKGAAGYLERFGTKTDRAYVRATEIAKTSKAHGSDMPALIDRLCELRGIQPNQLFTALQNNRPFGRSPKGLWVREGVSMPPGADRLAALAKDLELADDTVRRWIRLHREIGELAAWCRRSILVQTSPTSTGMLAARLDVHLNPGCISGDLWEEDRREIIRICRHENLKAADYDRLQAIFRTLHRADAWVKRMFQSKGAKDLSNGA